MDGTIEISEENGRIVWELNLCALPALVPQDVDGDGNYDDGIPVTFDAPLTVAGHKRAA